MSTLKIKRGSKILSWRQQGKYTGLYIYCFFYFFFCRPWMRSCEELKFWPVALMILFLDFFYLILFCHVSRLLNKTKLYNLKLYIRDTNWVAVGKVSR